MPDSVLCRTPVTSVIWRLLQSAPVFLLELIFVRIVVIFWHPDTGWHPANEEIREKSQPEYHTQAAQGSTNGWEITKPPDCWDLRAELAAFSLTAPALQPNNSSNAITDRKSLFIIEICRQEGEVHLINIFPSL